MVTISPVTYQPFNLSTVLIMCGWRDSNPHALRRQILSLVCLPISPHPLLWPTSNSALFGVANVGHYTHQNHKYHTIMKWEGFFIS